MVSYVYEPDSYVPLARLDATGASTEAGGLGTTADPVAEENLQAPSAPSAHPTAATSYQNNSNPANDGGGRDWQALQAGNQVKPLNIANGNHRICEVFYFHTDQVGLPEELTNSQGKLCWQASYKTWGSTVAEEWEVRSTAGQAVNALDEGSKPTIEQNLRFQGQYLDRDTGLHYNTFRFYDADIGRFLSPDPIGLLGGINLGVYSPNPISWIDPWGWNKNNNNTVGDWILYEVSDPKGGKAKIGIGKAEDVMADGTNRRANASARKVAKDPKFPNAKATELSRHNNITKGAMKEIEAARVRELRRSGQVLPHNRENDARYKIKENNKGKGKC